MPATLPVRKTATGPIPEHAIVRLSHELPAQGLKAGDEGTVVHVYNKGAAYEVEFIEGRTRPMLVTLEPVDIEPTKSD